MKINSIVSHYKINQNTQIKPKSILSYVFTIIQIYTTSLLITKSLGVKIKLKQPMSTFTNDNFSKTVYLPSPPPQMFPKMSKL